MNIFNNKKLKIALVCVINKNRKYSMNKDLNGGIGTADDLGGSFLIKILEVVRKRTIRLPIVSFALLQAILKQQGHAVEYFEERMPQNNFDLFIIYGSIVDFENENNVAGILKERHPESKVGFIGPFPSIKPELFNNADFIVAGESESFFINDFRNLNQLQGVVTATNLVDLDSLPSPCYDGFPIKKYSYKPFNSRKPFLLLQASRGCPFSCKFYCTYGEFQGAKVRLRSPTKVVDDIVYLKKRYDVKGIQFRDPVFGIDSEFVFELCDELKKREVMVVWGMETRVDLLNEDIIKRMYEVGLRNINIGIETNNIKIANNNKRKLTEARHQENIISICQNYGIKIGAFYMICFEDDTQETIEETIKYAIKLGTPFARFAITTPYPGTDYYEQLESENKILTKNYEKYTQFNLVYKHNSLSPDLAQKLVENAYVKYYFRISYIYRMIRLQMREYWL